jgi:hypothetical protein
LTLEDTTKTFADVLKNVGSNIKILSDQQITLSDGNIAREGEVEFQSFGVLKILSHHISVIKENKWIRVSTFTHPSFFDDELRNIGRSLVFKVPLAEIP